MKWDGINVINRWSSFSYLLTFILILPIVLVINHALGSETQTLIHLKETVLSEYISSTLILVLAVGFLTLILGVATAYLTTFYQFRFVNVFVFALALPFASSYVHYGVYLF